MRSAVPACAVAIALAWLAGHPDARSRWQPRDLVRAVGGFSAAQADAVERGEAVAKVLRTDRREIAIVGAVRIRGPRERLLDRYRDVSNLRKSEIVLQVGTFSRPPRVENLSGLTIEAYDLDAPRECVSGDCPVRLSTEMIARMRSAVKWTAPEARHQSAAAWRDILTDIANAYTTTGDAALPVYANKAEPLPVKNELDALYEQFGFLGSVAPEFLRYLREYPRVQLQHVEDTLYWSKYDLGIRPVMGITHQAVYAPPGRPAVVAVKRIYAAHYIDGGLGVTTLTDDGAGGFYMMIVDRIRTRSLTSFTRAIARSMVQDRSRDGLEKMLRSSQRSLEGLTPSR